MTKRYFKATDGERTYFRASPSMPYQSLTPIAPGQRWAMHLHARGQFPVVEIDAAEFRTLTLLKKLRAPGASAPRHSWIFNAQLEALDDACEDSKEIIRAASIR